MLGNLRKPLKRVQVTALASTILVTSGISAAHAQDVELRYAIHPGSHVQPLLDYFIPKYEELTGVRVIGEVLPPDQLRDRMTIEAIGNTGYFDMGYHSPGWFGSFVDHVADLRPFIEKYGMDLDAFPELVVEAHMSSTARPGDIISIAHTPSAPIFAARRDWFEHPDERAAFEEQHGRELEYPQSWQDLHEVGQFFTRDAGDTLAGNVLERPVYGWSDSLRHPSGAARAFLLTMYSAGLAGFDEDYMPDIDQPIFLEATELFERLVHDTAPPTAYNWDFLEHLEYFREGRLAMATLWAFGIDTVEDPDGDAAGNVHYKVLPVYEGNLGGYTQGVPYIGGGGIMVFDTPNAEESFKFLQWLIEDQSMEWARMTANFFRPEHFADEELVNQRPFYPEYLPVLQDALDAVFIRQGIPEYGSVIWNAAGDYATDVHS
ncbi:ABC transporter substrate-binding protein [Roseinatronobacter sp. S2]|uniref:ABC transporter substrate-binding protein n=1 Tax=Roseinatronobacter sp. S2 TaxID=3035471 RepID=UPI00241087ED|nr:extracellular solute-binding protein [Roseinatronobacter sp. S2]WFE75329.1 extracellular solute-binding protein [Roseinatronobacter sp. S2]